MTGASLVRYLSLAIVFSAASVSFAQSPAGKPMFASPHADPIALSPTVQELYVVNTPADTLDVIDTSTQMVIASVIVGVDPVSVEVRPDGNEVWVSNHVSDSVSVIDTDPASPSRYQVIATVTAWDEDGWVTDFDEPAGIAFASNAKAYVALTSRNRIAVVDVATRTVTKQIQVLSQEPRALEVRGDRLYAIPFESGNQTEISGCLDPNHASANPGCTFSIFILATNGLDAILTRNFVADIIRNDRYPDRDLFVYDTADESTLFEVDTLGTLLYGLTVDSTGKVFIAMTEARNDANGLSGTAGHDLPEMENRAFLNQIARVDCSVPTDCSVSTIFDLEPLPPANPAAGDELATPFGIQISADDSTIVSVAAGTSRLFTVDAVTGAILGKTDVGAIPRGLALESDSGDGSPDTAWVYNALDNSVSVVDVSTPSSPSETAVIPLFDPTHADVKAGRIAFNDAFGSTTGTFSCASCHPDGNTDQLLWNLGAICITPGCDQTQPRSTMPIRGLRDTLPLHWDGVPGDPFGGTNAELADSGPLADPNCTDEHSCFRDLVNGAQSGTMCDPGACPTNINELGLAGAFTEAERDAMAVFLRSVPYPPARDRRLDDSFSALASEGFRNFLVGIDAAHPGCSRAGGFCHSLPFWNGTNTPGTGFDAPTFRGIPDRHVLLPNGRGNTYDALQLTQFNDVQWDPDDGPDELFIWGVTFGNELLPLANRASSGTGPFSFFQLFLEGGFGFSATYGKQVSLDQATAVDADTLAILAQLEEADSDGVINLHADGVTLPVGDGVQLAYEDGIYVGRDDPGLTMTSAELVADAASGNHIVTVTARMGTNSDVDHPQPALWMPPDPASPDFLAFFPKLTEGNLSFQFFGRHIADDPIVLVDGRAVGASVSCETGGTFPDCTGESFEVVLDELPTPGGDHRLQLVTPGGMSSNEILVTTAVCGDGEIDEGEICDGTPDCTSACLPAGSCPAAPVSGCTGGAAGKSQVKIKDGDAKSPSFPLHSKDQAQGKLKKMDAVTGAELGDPSTTDDTSFCFYDEIGLVFGVDIAAGDPGWSCKLTTPGKEQCKFKDKDGNAFGVTGAKIKAGATGKAQSQIKIRLGSFAAPVLPIPDSGAATAQMTTTAGMCQEAVFVGPFSKNDGAKGQFQAKN